MSFCTGDLVNGLLKKTLSRWLWGWDDTRRGMRSIAALIWGKEPRLLIFKGYIYWQRVDLRVMWQRSNESGQFRLFKSSVASDCTPASLIELKYALIFSHIRCGWMDALVFFINVHAGLGFLGIVRLVWRMETNTSHWMLYPRLDFNLEDGVWINLLLNSYFKGYLAGFTAFHFSFPRKVAVVSYWTSLSESLILMKGFTWICPSV